MDTLLNIELSIVMLDKVKWSEYRTGRGYVYITILSRSRLVITVVADVHTTHQEHFQRVKSGSQVGGDPGLPALQ